MKKNTDPVCSNGIVRSVNIAALLKDYYDLDYLNSLDDKALGILAEGETGILSFGWEDCGADNS